MTYSKTTWTNSSGQPISATNLNKIEQGIYDAHNATAVNVQWYGAVADYNTSLNTGTDNGPAFQAALNAAGTRPVYVPPGNYGFSSGFSVPAYTALVGAVRGDGQTLGSSLFRMSNITLVKIQGIESVLLNGNYNAHNVRARIAHLLIHGGGQLADLMQAKYARYFTIDHCWFFGGSGRQLLCQEVFDSRINYCEFEYGGSTDGTLPNVDLYSAAGEEYTNQIYFTGCRWESYQGIALATRGSITNEIFLCGANKFESGISNLQPIKIIDAGTVDLGECQITTRGATGQTIPAHLTLNNSTTISGKLFSEHITTAPSASLQTLVSITGGGAIDLDVHAYANGDVINASTLVVSDTDNNVNVRGTISGSGAKNFANFGDTTKLEGLRIGKYGEGHISFRNKNASDGAEYWSLGRPSVDGTGSRFRLIHGGSGGESTIYEVTNSNDLTIPRPLYVQNTMIHTPSTTQSITAVGNTILANARYVRISAATSFTLTSAPTIANGTDGQIVTIVSVGAGAVTLQDQGTLASSNLRLGAATRALSTRDSITLMYSSDVGDWIEVGFSNVL